MIGERIYKRLGDYIKEYSVKNKAGEDIPVYSVTNSQGFCKEYFSKEVASQDKTSYKIVPYGYFAFNPSRINVGSIDWHNKEDKVIVSPLYNVFSVSESMLQPYLLYFLKSPATIKYIDTIATGTVRLNLKLSMLKDFVLPIPSISIQRTIVSELDKINELLLNKKTQLRDIDALSLSIFYDMFGDPVDNEKRWTIIPLGEIAEFKNGLNFNKGESGYCYKFLGVSDFLENKKVCSSSLSNINLSEKISDDYLLQTGDIVFVRSNGSKELVGRNILMEINEPTTYSGFCIRCRITNEEVNSVFLSYLLKTPSMRPIITNSGRGCNISNLNQKILCGLPIIHPSLDLQESFATRVSAIDNQRMILNQSISDLETLLASRLQHWFI